MVYRMEMQHTIGENEENQGSGVKSDYYSISINGGGGLFPAEKSCTSRQVIYFTKNFLFPNF